MAVRDRVVRWTLAGGAVLALLAWHLVGPWASLVLVVLALGVAAVAYRVEPSRIDVDRPSAWSTDPAEPRIPDRAAPVERVDQ